jgi:hypothetical protein
MTKNTMLKLSEDIRHLIDAYRRKRDGAAAAQATDGGDLLHPLDDFVQPPYELEKKTGLTRIGTRYVLPAGIGAEDLQTYAIAVLDGRRKDDFTPEVAEKKLRRVFNALAKKNPDIAALRLPADDAQSYYHVILGVASGFNATDIQSYLDGNYFYVCNGIPAYRELSEAVRDTLGIRHFGWVPSMATLREMKRQADNLAPPSPDSTGRSVSAGQSVNTRQAGGAKPSGRKKTFG